MRQNNGFYADAAKAFTQATSGKIDEQLGERLANSWMSQPFLAFLAETTQSPVQLMTMICLDIVPLLQSPQCVPQNIAINLATSSE